MKNLAVAVLFIGSTFVFPGCDSERRGKNFNANASTEADGLEFITAANEAGLTEIKASALAETMSKNPRIINFAKMMMADHSRVNAELSNIADNKLANQTDTISSEHQKKIDSLAHMASGFDKAYMIMMVNDHTSAVNLYAEAGANRNATVQKFAKKNLPVLKVHLDSAQMISASLK